MSSWEELWKFMNSKSALLLIKNERIPWINFYICYTACGFKSDENTFFFWWAFGKTRSFCDAKLNLPLNSWRRNCLMKHDIALISRLSGASVAFASETCFAWWKTSIRKLLFVSTTMREPNPIEQQKKTEITNWAWSIKHLIESSQGGWKKIFINRKPNTNQSEPEKGTAKTVENNINMLEACKKASAKRICIFRKLMV